MMTDSGIETRAALATLASLTAGRLEGLRDDPRSLRAHPDLLLLSHLGTSDHSAEVYDPVACLVVQGAKQTATTDRTFTIADGEYLIVTHDMPVVSRITEASAHRPYLAVILSLDRRLLADLVLHSPGPPDVGEADPHALRVGSADADLVGAFVRYLRALNHAADADVLVPLAVREIHYRLLRAPGGHALRRLAKGHRQSDTVARAIEIIRQDLTRSLSVRALAAEVGLSASSFHSHFKAVTGTTPVQYQKQLRLLEARRLIRTSISSITDAAHAVGYASPTQFSREYRRAFGRAPSSDREEEIA